MEVTVFAALAEPNRLRIVELLADAPSTVGEVAASLGLRQPQVTKHLQILERAGLVEVHPLGRRRVCALRREALDHLARWAGGLAVPGADDATLVRYRAAIASVAVTPVRVSRAVPATQFEVWRALTDPAIASLWWHPPHFTVSTFRMDTSPGGAVELSLREGDGAEHRARGHMLTADPPCRLSFTLDPLDAGGRALFTAHHDFGLSAADDGTDLELTITPSGVHSNAEVALAGLEIGWEQLLNNLVALAADSARTGTRSSGGPT